MTSRRFPSIIKLRVLTAASTLMLCSCGRSNVKIEGDGFVTVTKSQLSSHPLPPLDLGIGDDRHWRIIWHVVDFNRGGIQVVDHVVIFTAQTVRSDGRSLLHLFAANTNGVVYDVDFLLKNAAEVSNVTLLDVHFEGNKLKCNIEETTPLVDVSLSDVASAVKMDSSRWSQNADGYNKWNSIKDN